VIFPVVGKVEIDVGSVNVVVSVENVMELERVVASEEEEAVSVLVSAMVVEVEVVSTDVVEVDIVVSSVVVGDNSVEDEEAVALSVVGKVEIVVDSVVVVS